MTLNVRGHGDYLTLSNCILFHRSNVDHVRMTRCLVEELKSLLALSGIGNVTSVYFGGGIITLAQTPQNE